MAPPDDPLRGARSIAPLLSDESISQDSVVVYDEYGGGRMIRTERYKLIVRHDGPQELYDLCNDPYERENLSGVSCASAVAAELSDCLHEWFADHQTALNNAWDRQVWGRDEVHPPRVGYDDARTHVRGGLSMDGVRHG